MDQQDTVLEAALREQSEDITGLHAYFWIPLFQEIVLARTGAGCWNRLHGFRFLHMFGHIHGYMFPQTLQK